MGASCRTSKARNPEWSSLGNPDPALHSRWDAPPDEGVALPAGKASGTQTKSGHQRSTNLLKHNGAFTYWVFSCWGPSATDLMVCRGSTWEPILAIKASTTPSGAVAPQSGEAQTPNTLGSADGLQANASCALYPAGYIVVVPAGLQLREGQTTSTHSRHLAKHPHVRMHASLTEARTG